MAHSPWGGVRHHAPSGKRRLNHGELGTLPSERRKPAAGDSPGRWRGAGMLGPQHAATPRWGAGGAAARNTSVAVSGQMKPAPAM